MKKTLVALAVAAAAVSASATTVYSNDGTTFDIGGRVDVALGKFGDNQRGDLRNNESRIDFHAEHQITDGVKALAHLRIRFNENGDRWDSSNSFNDPTTNKLWAGLQADNIGRLTFGRQNTSGDDVQLNDPTYLFGGNNNLTDGGKKVVTFRSADFEIAQGQTLTFGLDYLFGQSNKKDLKAGELKHGYGAALFYNGQYTDDLSLELNAGATFDKFDNAINTAGAKEKKSWRVASLLHYGPAALGAEYGQSTFKNVNNVDTDSTDGKARFLEVGAQYQVLPESKVYLQWQRNEFKGRTTTDFETEYSLAEAALKDAKLKDGDKAVQNVYLIGADYAFTKNVVTYVEYAHSRVKLTRANVADATKDNENFYGVGLRVYF
ncbi:porin [Necropsobacter massiliensis]|uniref:porin n=1 Tax=Necropsobacter massiliensis TaxID=1400001 RepID=UPI000595F180|nr:porin [Necropsobacter massiliensis]